MTHDKFKSDEESLEDRFNNVFGKYVGEYSNTLRTFVDEMFTRGFTFKDLRVENRWPYEDKIEFDFYHGDLPRTDFTARFSNEKVNGTAVTVFNITAKNFDTECASQESWIIQLQDSEELYFMSTWHSYCAVSFDQYLSDFYERMSDVGYDSEIRSARSVVDREERKIDRLEKGKEALKNFMENL